MNVTVTLLVAQIRCFLVTKSFAFTLILPTCILNPKPYLRGHNGIPVAGISCSFAFEVVGKSSSQHLVTGSFIAHVVAAALKFPKDIFSRKLSVPKIGRNKRNWSSLCRNFPDTPPPPRPNYSSLLPWTLGGTWRNLEISFL